MSQPCQHVPISPAMLALGSMVLIAGTWATELRAVERYEGLAYASRSGKLLYRESHWIQPDGKRVVLYRCPGGAAFARKQVHDGGVSPDFELVDARDGYREGVRTRAGQREVFTQASRAAAIEVKPLPAGATPVIDAGFDTYVRQQWNALGRSAGRRITFVVPSRLQLLDLHMKPINKTPSEQRFRLSLDAWYGGLVPGIELTYATQDRRLLKFSGIGNIRDGNGKYPEIRIEFPDAARGRGSLQDYVAATASGLVASCQDS